MRPGNRRWRAWGLGGGGRKGPGRRAAEPREGGRSSDVDFRCLTIDVTAMTLVVAQRKGAILSVVSNTDVSQNGMPLPRDKRIPKICTLSPDFAVGLPAAWNWR